MVTELEELRSDLRKEVEAREADMKRLLGSALAGAPAGSGEAAAGAVDTQCRMSVNGLAEDIFHLRATLQHGAPQGAVSTLSGEIVDIEEVRKQANEAKRVAEEALSTLSKTMADAVLRALEKVQA